MIENGPVTQSYSLDRQQAIDILNEALATEIVCVLRYRFHYFMATGLHSPAVAEEFLEHSKEEQEHADSIAVRIKQLGGKPELNPEVISTTSHSQYIEGRSLTEMLKEDLARKTQLQESSWNQFSQKKKNMQMNLRIYCLP